MSEDTPSEVPLPPDAPSPVSATTAPPTPEIASIGGTSPPTAGQAVSRRDRRLGLAGEVAGIVGIVVCLLLIVAAILGRNWLVGTVDQAASGVDTALGAGVTLIDTASTRVADVSARVGAVTDAADALAANPNPVPKFSDTVTARLAPLSDRYLALRTAYAGFRERVVSAFDRLTLLDRLLPGFSIPQGPVDTLKRIDARAQDLDASVASLMEIAPGARAANAFGSAAAAGAGKVSAALAGVTSGLDELKGKLQSLQSDVTSASDRVNLAITLADLVLILVLLYIGFLNLVLYWSARRLQRGH